MSQRKNDRNVSVKKQVRLECQWLTPKGACLKTF